MRMFESFRNYFNRRVPTKFQNCKTKNDSDLPIMFVNRNKEGIMQISVNVEDSEEKMEYMSQVENFAKILGTKYEVAEDCVTIFLDNK